MQSYLLCGPEQRLQASVIGHTQESGHVLGRDPAILVTIDGSKSIQEGPDESEPHPSLLGYPVVEHHPAGEGKAQLLCLHHEEVVLQGLDASGNPQVPAIKGMDHNGGPNAGPVLLREVSWVK